MSKKISRSKKVFGVAINDYDGSVCDENGKLKDCFKHWYGMLQRCYYENRSKHWDVYIGCSVCDEWLHSTNFIEWYNQNYIDGYQIDKDLLCKGNKVYSPYTCCFLPKEINSFLTKSNKARGKYPIGVSCRGSKYESNISIDGICIYLGLFDTPEEAFYAYKQAKERQCKVLAQRYKNAISNDAYNALMNYSVEIDD